MNDPRRLVRLRAARVVDLLTGHSGEPEDLWVWGERLIHARAVDPAWGTPEDYDLDGRWVIPGLWDAHVHFGQWSLRSSWVDLSQAASTSEIVGALSRQVDSATAGRSRADRATAARSRPDHGALVVGAGVRDAGLAEAALEALEAPVLMVGTDLHTAWATRAGLVALHLPSDRSRRLEEEDAFAAIRAATQTSSDVLDEAVEAAERAAASRGLVGIVDLEMDGSLATWPGRLADGIDKLRVRVGCYPDRLDEVLAARIRTGDPLEPTGLARLGPLKVIGDGSLTSRSAWCHQPYPNREQHRSCGSPNLDRGKLEDLMRQAGHAGLDVAIHAIGDQAVTTTLRLFEHTGAHGSIEHAQLVAESDIAAMARLGVCASVQPAHLLDDAALMDQIWSDRADRAFPLASLAAAGVELRFGSDAPVAPLDPWLAVQTAVTRARPGEPAWHPEQRLTRSQALVASTDQITRLQPDGAADLAVLESDPFAIDDDQLADIRVGLTMVAGRVTHQQL